MVFYDAIENEIIDLDYTFIKIYMLFADWEVRIVKSYDGDLQNFAKGRRGRNFQAQDYSISLHGPTLSQ